MKESVNSLKLYRYIKDHGGAYDLFAFIPYMFGTTFYGVQIHPEKSILIPCLHEESYAHLRLLREPFSQVAGMTFLSEPEGELAGRLYDLRKVDARVLGAGVDPFDDSPASGPDLFRTKYGIKGPFILYAGRKDSGKNVDVLIRYFAEYKRRQASSLKLILIGGGEISIPEDQKSAVMDLGFIPLQDKQDAYRAATLLCQPSSHESFSIVIMESWLAGRPVLVSGHCAVTRNFVRKAQGGLYFEDYQEFETCLNYLLQRPDLCDAMGRNGKRYVEDHFTWDHITENYMSYFEDLIKR